MNNLDILFSRLLNGSSLCIVPDDRINFLKKWENVFSYLDQNRNKIDILVLLLCKPKLLELQNTIMPNEYVYFNPTLYLHKF